MNSKKKNIRKTSGTRKKYKPGQLITICKDVFRIRKNTSVFTDYCMCNLKLQQQKQWCRYCMDNLHFCYFELVKKDENIQYQQMYKPGQLITVNNKLFRVMKKPLSGHCCEGCYFHKRKLFNDACYRFCYFLPGNCKFVLNEKSVKHKG